MSKSKRSVGEKYNSPFAKSIRELMIVQGTTQDALAEKIGKTRQTVSQYVNGISEPGYDTLVKIADYFSVSTDYLLGRNVPKTIDTTVQAVIAYTGLSEDNVIILHETKQQMDQYQPFSYGVNRQIDGNSPTLDCANDLLNAIFTDYNIIAEYYLLRAQITSAQDYDPDYYRPEVESDLFAHGHTTMPVIRAAQYACAELVKHIEWYLRGKYINPNITENTPSTKEE